MSRRRVVVAVVFGGRSVEHDVSIVTGHQIMEAFPAARYEVVPVYISRDGRFFTGEPLRKLDTFRDEDLPARDGVEACLLSPDTRHHGLIINPLAGRFSRSRVKRLDVVFPGAAWHAWRRWHNPGTAGIGGYPLCGLRHAWLGADQ